MIMYDWVDCSKEEFDKHWMEGTHRRIPIYPEDSVTEIQGILVFKTEPPEPIGYRYQKGINPRQVLICDPKIIQRDPDLAKLFLKKK